MKFTEFTLLLLIAMLVALTAPTMATQSELEEFSSEDMDFLEDFVDVHHRALDEADEDPEAISLPEDPVDTEDTPDSDDDDDDDDDDDCEDDQPDCVAANDAEGDANAAGDAADDAAEEDAEATLEEEDLAADLAAVDEASDSSDDTSDRRLMTKSVVNANKRAAEAQRKAAEAKQKAAKAEKKAEQAKAKAEKVMAKALETKKLAGANKKKFRALKNAAKAQSNKARAAFNKAKSGAKKADAKIKKAKKAKDAAAEKAARKEKAGFVKQMKAAAKAKAAADKEVKKQSDAEKKACKKEKAAGVAAKKAQKAAKKAADAAKKAGRIAENREKDAVKKVRVAGLRLKKAIENARKAEERAAKRAAKKEEREAAKAARKAAREAKRAAKKAAKAARKAAKALKKKLRKKRKQKKAKKDLDIIGGKCVADHVCATVRGDPHLTTYDGLKFDCQGHGEFVLAKSMETGFEIQGRFEKTGRKDKSVSITKAISIDTGVEGAPQLDVFTEEVEGVCVLNYYVNGQLADFGEDGKAYPGLDFMEDVDAGREIVDFAYFTGSGVMYTVLVKKGNFGCVLNSKICLPPDMVKEQTIIGLLGTPNNDKSDDWMSAFGSDLKHGGKTKWGPAFEYCTREWCVHKEEDSIFGYLDGTSWGDFYGCSESYDPSAEEAVKSASAECVECCSPLTGEDENEACLLECMEGDTEDCKIEIENEEVLADVESKCPDTNSNKTDSDDDTDDRSFNAPPKETPKKGSGSGDPHFKTWSGDKYDYHGECDLVLLDHPTFYNGLGLRVHIRTTRVKYFSFIEIVTVQIGEDTLEFDNSVDNFLINGATVDENRDHRKTYLGFFFVRRDKKSLSIRLLDNEDKDNGVVAKIDLHTRKNGFPAVIVDGGHTDLFKGSLGLLGDWATGKKLGRDGVTEFTGEDATPFALEWQVGENDPKLFSEERYPQFPNVCLPPEKMPARLGMDLARKEAEEACGHWEDDKEDCIFDVIATRDILVAQEGHIVHVE